MNDRVIQSLNLPVSGLTLSRLPFSKQTHINPGQFKNTKMLVTKLRKSEDSI